MKLFKKNIKKNQILKKDIIQKNDILPKIISLAFLSTVCENIIHDKNCKNPERKIVDLIKQTTNLFFQLKLLSKFQNNTRFNFNKKLGLITKHKQLWQDI